jgi:RNA 2',3'-cyclic 3'-phosphodiesterase
VRLFLAADIDHDTRRQLAAAQESLRSVLSQARLPPRVTWVSPGTAHVTLRFIGETSEDNLTRLQQVLTTLRFDPFEVTWGAVGSFGGSRHPKVIWVGLTAGLDSFTQLAQEIDARIDPVLCEGRSQPFAPHLTVGRVKESGRGVDWPRALQAVRFTPTSTRVAQVTLYQSRLSSKGPTYTAVRVYG